MLMYVLIIFPIIFIIYYYNINKFNKPPKLIRQKVGLYFFFIL